MISPEGCASILWRTAEKAADAAEAMQITAADLKQLGVIDRIVAEPVGGAHRDPAEAIEALGAAIGEELDAFAGARPATRSARSAAPNISPSADERAAEEPRRPLSCSLSRTNSSR